MRLIEFVKAKVYNLILTFRFSSGNFQTKVESHIKKIQNTKALIRKCEIHMCGDTELLHSN